MSSENNQNSLVQAIKNKPIVSSLCFAWGPVAYGGMSTVANADNSLLELITMATLYSAPALSAAVAVIGGVNIVRHKSILSKPTSIAALGLGGFGLATWYEGITTQGDTSGLAEGLGYILAGMYASAGGALNVVSHYTRDVGAKIGVVKPNGPSA